jgi:undecaprenyl diphosphate synthase
MQTRIPRHVGFIPDGNRRWAQQRGRPKQEGYASGIDPGVELVEYCQRLGVDELSIYGFTQDNLKRPEVQQQAFMAACVSFAQAVERKDVALLVVGDAKGTHFPAELLRFRERQGSGMKVNLLCNYGWDWDLDGIKNGGLRSAEVSRLELIVRWGGGRRLSGFLPVQSVYADFFVVDELWPDYHPAHFNAALRWYARQDPTLGG